MYVKDVRASALALRRRSKALREMAAHLRSDSWFQLEQAREWLLVADRITTSRSSGLRTIAGNR
jgi:hypothetical protein